MADLMMFKVVDLLKIRPGDSDGDDERMWFEKMTEVFYSDAFDSIMTEGIRNPVVVNFETLTIQNGHHRVAAAILLGMEYIPVHSYEHYNQWDDSEGNIEWDGPEADLPTTCDTRYSCEISHNENGYDIGVNNDEDGAF